MDKKNNRKNFVNMATGGAANRFSDSRKTSEREVEPMKTTGVDRDEPRLPAFAQASPVAREVVPVEIPKSEEEELKTIAANSQDVEEALDDDDDDEDTE